MMPKRKKTVQERERRANADTTEDEVRPFRLLDLSAELRDQIYEHMVVCENGVHVDASRRLDSKCRASSTRSLALLLTSHAVYAEAVPILYGRNEFIFWQERALARFSKSTGDNVKHIRKLRVNMIMHKAELHRIKLALKPAHMLSALEIEVWGLDRISANETATILGPLFRVLHASQKKDAERKSRDVTDVLRVSGRFLRGFAREEVQNEYDARVKELIAATLT